MKPLPIFLAPLFLTACGVLKPVEDTSVHHLLNATIPERHITGSKPVVAIASPALPSYLDRQQLVNRTGDGELQMNTYHLWGEPLADSVSRVTSINLSRLTNSMNIQPVKNFVTMDYESLLEIRIERFEPDPNDIVILQCTWKIQPVAGALAPTRSFLTQVPVLSVDSGLQQEVSGGPLTHRVRAMNEALARLAREIAKSL